MDNNTQQNFIYVSGAAPNNHNGCTKGGVGVAVYNSEGGFVFERFITVDRATDNAELELMALVEGLEYAQDGDVIYSVSDFCVKGYNEWLDGWKSKGWRKTDKKPVAYRSFWLQVDSLRSGQYVEVVKIKAHSGIKGHKRADDLASMAARK